MKRFIFYAGLVLLVAVGAGLPQGFKAFERGKLLRAPAGTMIRECYDCAAPVGTAGVGQKIGALQTLRTDQWFTWTRANGPNAVEIAGEDYYILHPAKQGGPRLGWDASRVVLAQSNALSDWQRTFRWSKLLAFVGLFVTLAVMAHLLDKRKGSLQESSPLQTP